MAFTPEKVGEKMRFKSSSIPGFVYLMQSAGGAHKIGRAVNVESRRKQHVAAVGADMTVIHVVNVRDMKQAEARSHKLFRAYRIVGMREWYRLPLSQVEYFCGLTDDFLCHDRPVFAKLLQRIDAPPRRVIWDYYGDDRLVRAVCQCGHTLIGSIDFDDRYGGDKRLCWKCSPTADELARLNKIPKREMTKASPTSMRNYERLAMARRSLRWQSATPSNT